MSICQQPFRHRQARDSTGPGAGNRARPGIRPGVPPSRLAPSGACVIPSPAMPKLPGLQVLRSAVSGYGLWATRDFAEGEVISEIDGVTFFLPDPRDDTYALLIAPGVLYDIVDQTRFVNHSCEPNTYVETGQFADGQAWAKLVALRPIRAAEELFFDYAFPAELAVPCHCGASSCRGHIVAPDELPRLRAMLDGDRIGNG